VIYNLGQPKRPILHLPLILFFIFYFYPVATSVLKGSTEQNPGRGREFSQPIH
jgi:hypothetical protein